MSRKIKFRLWSTIYNKFIINNNENVDFVINTAGNLYSIEHSYCETCILPQMCTEIMQYTELKDKNGKEIYEGDILRYIFPNDRRLKHVSPVKFLESEASFGLKDTYGNEIPLYKITANNYFEVIGNIYENHKLLEEK